MKTAPNRVVSPSTGASITTSARLRPAGGCATGLVSICTRIGTRVGSVGSEGWVTVMGHAATGVGDGEGLGLGLGEGLGLGVGDGVGDGVGAGVGVGSGAPVSMTAPAPTRMATTMTPPT